MVEVLEKLEKLMRKNRDHIHQMVYKRALETVRSLTEDVMEVDQLKGKRYIGPIILSKFKEYIETGTLSLFEREKEKPGYEQGALYDQLSDIYGVGPKKAQDLIDKGITSIEDLRTRQDELLNESQKAGLKYYDDILKRIPRSEIDEYNTIFKRVFEKVTVNSPQSKYEIVGSYRRGLQESGDIDLILTSPDKSIFKKFTDALKEENIILVTLSSGASKCLVITKLTPQRTARRVDFLYSSPEEFPFAILYFTGSKEFNTVMRGHALKMGVSLNEHGLSKKEPGKKKEELVSHRFKSENDIFDYLGLEFKEPTERLNGQAVEVKGQAVETKGQGQGQGQDIDVKESKQSDFDTTNWRRGKYSQNCNTVCKESDMKCDTKLMNTLDSSEKISALAAATGAECLKHLETEEAPFLEDFGGKGCWNIKPGSVSSKRCSKKSEKWTTNLCACAPKNKSVKKKSRK
jgi:DNA polymerase beta